MKRNNWSKNGRFHHPESGQIFLKSKKNASSLLIDNCFAILEFMEME